MYVSIWGREGSLCLLSDGREDAPSGSLWGWLCSLSHLSKGRAYELSPSCLPPPSPLPLPLSPSPSTSSFPSPSPPCLSSDLCPNYTFLNKHQQSQQPGPDKSQMVHVHRHTSALVAQVPVNQRLHHGGLGGDVS